jgi:hypothetical protein
MGVGVGVVDVDELAQTVVWDGGLGWPLLSAPRSGRRRSHARTHARTHLHDDLHVGGGPGLHHTLSRKWRGNRC